MSVAIAFFVFFLFSTLAHELVLATTGDFVLNRDNQFVTCSINPASSTGGVASLLDCANRCSSNTACTYFTYYGNTYCNLFSTGGSACSTFNGQSATIGFYGLASLMGRTCGASSGDPANCYRCSTAGSCAPVRTPVAPVATTAPGSPTTFSLISTTTQTCTANPAPGSAAQTNLYTCASWCATSTTGCSYFAFYNGWCNLFSTGTSRCTYFNGQSTTVGFYGLSTVLSVACANSASGTVAPQCISCVGAACNGVWGPAPAPVPAPVAVPGVTVKYSLISTTTQTCTANPAAGSAAQSSLLVCASWCAKASGCSYFTFYNGWCNLFNTGTSRCTYFNGQSTAVGFYGLTTVLGSGCSVSTSNPPQCISCVVGGNCNGVTTASGINEDSGASSSSQGTYTAVMPVWLQVVVAVCSIVGLALVMVATISVIRFTTRHSVNEIV